MTAVATTTAAPDDDRDWLGFLERVQQRAAQNMIGPVFTTSATELWALFMNDLPTPALQQIHNCRTCRSFMDRYAGLAYVDADGQLQPLLWDIDDVPPIYRLSMMRIIRRIRQAHITGVFYSREITIGTAQNEGKERGQIWNHFSFTNVHPFTSMVKTPEQAMAEKLEDYRMLCRAMADYTIEHVQAALALLRGGDSLYRGETVLGVAEWLHNLMRARAAYPGDKDRLTWLAVAKAPAGFCHVRSTMIGTLLDDLATGLDYERVAQRFADKMHPLKYQRPQAAPAAGNIKQAEQIIQQLDAAGALRRRFARLTDINKLWSPPQAEPQPVGTDGVFAGVTPKSRTRETVIIGGTPRRPTTITWEKFQRTVLANARTIEYYVTAAPDHYCALVTRADPNCETQIFKWRHPVSWYVYHPNSAPSQWNLSAGKWHQVTAITLQPSMWEGEDRHTQHGKAVIFALHGCRDSNRRSAGLGLFPEILRGELHPVRATLEAFSQKGEIEETEGDLASGVRLQAGQNWHARVRVTAFDGIVTEYLLDRWD